MQFTAIFTTLAALATLALATGTGNQCENGPVQCCNSVESAGSASASKLLAGLGVAVQGVDVPIGINCSPISVLSAGGNSCNAQTVCCQNNSFNGVIAIGCIGTNINA